MDEQSKMVIPYARQEIDDDDINAVTNVLKSEFLTQGPSVGHFEDAVAALCGANFSIAFNSATSGLHAACLALGVGPGDIVWTSPNTFVASANCALYCGATVDFVDINPLTYNMSVDKLADKLESARKSNNLPKVVIPVHFSGQSCDMKGIFQLSKEYGFKIIEDASHAIGGAYQNGMIGNCQYSNITIFSFHPVKIITSGEGGMASTNDSMLAKKLMLVRSHGITSDHNDMVLMPKGEIWNYQQIGLGFNYRMTDIHAALGLSQLNKLSGFVKKRHEIADYYNEALEALPIRLPYQIPESYSSYHLYVIRLNLADISITHEEVYRRLRAHGILVNLHYIPVYRHPFYKNTKFERGYCPNAEQYYADTLSIPMYTGLTPHQIDYVCKTLKMVIV